MSEYEMIVAALRGALRDVRDAAIECDECGSSHTADRLHNHAAGLREALYIVEKIHKQFI